MNDLELQREVEEKKRYEAEQKFFREAEENDRKMDIYLDILAVEMEKVKHQAIDIGASLDEQRELNDRNLQKMDQTTARLDKTNQTLAERVKSQGPEKWCCLFCFSVLLLAMIGYIVSKVS